MLPVSTALLAARISLALFSKRSAAILRLRPDEILAVAPELVVPYSVQL